MNAIPYGRQSITQADIDAVVAALKHPYLTQGPKIAEFEEKFAAYVGSKYAVANANGTAALHLCALALNVNENTNVITTPITFVASANCIKYCGGNITFADIDAETLTLDINHVRKILEAAPKGTYHGIVPVDFAGYPCDLEAFRALANEYDLWIIEDSCHSPGGWFTDSKGTVQRCGNGNFADLAIFSFHPVKHIASGEGGMITTNDKDLYERLLTLRTHGITKDTSKFTENHGGWYHQMHELGYNYRLTDFQAALGISQLAKADKGMERRQAISKRYSEAFANTVVQTHEAPEGIFNAHHLYIVELNNRKEVYDYLRTHQIYSQVHYIPVHTQPYYRNLETEKVVMPVAEKYYSRGLSLPMYPTLTEAEQEFVIEKVLAIAK